MADIELRFHNDMMVLSAPIDVTLERQGIDVLRDREYLNAMEPDVVRDAMQLQALAGAQCLVTNTQDITQARLAHVNMEDDAPRLAKAALAIANELRPQHVLAEIGPCGLPLDPSSKASLNENRKQYSDAARAFGDGLFDAFLLNGFSSIADLKCALMGVAQVSGKPVFASVVLGSTTVEAKSGETRPQPNADETLEEIARTHPFGADGFMALEDNLAPAMPSGAGTSLAPCEWPEAVDAMADLGAAVIGFETADPIALAVEYAREAAGRTDLPLLAQLQVSSLGKDAAKGLVPIEDVKEYAPLTLEHAAVKLYGAGVQFLRATGAATPACTGVLAATVQGLDVISGRG